MKHHQNGINICGINGIKTYMFISYIIMKGIHNTIYIILNNRMINIYTIPMSAACFVFFANKVGTFLRTKLTNVWENLVTFISRSYQMSCT